MSNRKTQFYQWLIDEKKCASKEAKRSVSIIKMLEEYSVRHSFEVTRLFDATSNELDSFIVTLFNNDFLRKSDERRQGKFGSNLLLLKEFINVCEITALTPKNDIIIDTVAEDALGASAAQHIFSNPATRGNKKKTPEEKLAHRMRCEFQKCRYIGDIHISEEEYALLKKSFQYSYKKICSSVNHESINPSFAVFLVQVGIRFYNGKFWIHVQNELGVEKLPATHKQWIGKSFYKTLVNYRKYTVAENEFMNNILLHCFVTEYYANDLFDFLFAYYKIDLDRDLTRNNPDMRKHLMCSMKKGESSARAYKIKKHTADAVSANEIGCKIRVGRILRFIDNALFNEIYPENSRNRVAQLFCAWAKTSKKFDYEKKHVNGLTHKGIKQYNTPYLHFNGSRCGFNLILPSQYIHLDDEEPLPNVTWKIAFGENEYVFDAESYSCVTGCKTNRLDNIKYPSEFLFKEIRLELWKNGAEQIQKFKINSDSARFFDSGWDMINTANYAKYLPIGQAFAFTYPAEPILTDSDAIVGCEKALGYDLYTLELKKGDVLRLPDGKAKSVGKPLEEGLLTQNLVSGAYAVKEDSLYSIYSDVPSVYLRMNPTQENGTMIVINSRRYRFDIEKCVRFDIEEKSDEIGYFIKLNDYISNDDIVNNGIYEVILDIPNSRKIHQYSFALISGFAFQFDAAPYIFCEKGTIQFTKQLPIRSLDNNITISDNQFHFSIHPLTDYLPFLVGAEGAEIDVHIALPILQWKFDDGEWNVVKPDEIWHKEFPKTIYLKYPNDVVTFSMTPIMFDNSENEDDENTFSTSFVKDKENNLFQCETRKMESWLGYEEARRVLYIEFYKKKFAFATIITRCYVNSDEVAEDRSTGELIFKSNISGYSNCVADIYYSGHLLAEKQPISTGGIRLKVPLRSGQYKIVYYEWDEEEDDFGFADYRKFDERILSYANKFDLCRRIVYIDGASEIRNSGSIFASKRLELNNPVKISQIINTDGKVDTFDGICLLKEKKIKVRIVLQNDNTKANITFFSEEEDDYVAFLYDKQTQSLATKEADTINAKQSYERYIVLEHEDYIFELKICIHGLRHTFAHEQYNRFIEEGYSDFIARKKVSELLGHHRDDVTRIYLSEGE